MSLHVFNHQKTEIPIFGISTTDYKPTTESKIIEKPEDLPDEFPFQFKDTSCGTLSWLKNSELNKELIFHALAVYLAPLPHDKFWLTIFKSNIQSMKFNN